MQDADALIKELEIRMRHDWTRMQRWSYVHGANGVLYSVILIVAPSVLAVGLVSSESILGKGLLFVIAVVGGLNATFKPHSHSQKRRTDMNSMRVLHDRFRGDIEKSGGDRGLLMAAYEKYSKMFGNVYELRGEGLLSATLSITEQRVNTEKGGAANGG